MDNSFEIEQSLLGSLLHLGDPESELVSKTLSVIKESAFNNQLHRTIYRAIKLLAHRGTPIDLITVDAECLKLDSENNYFVYLAEVQKSCVSSANIITYSKMLREKSIERYTLQKLNEAIGMFNDTSNGDVYQRIGIAESLISEISNMSLRNDKGGLKHVSDVSSGWLDNIDNIHKDGYDKNKLTTGVESVDDVLGVKGMRRGSLVAVGARPKMGKTAFLSLMANHFSLELKLPVGIFSMEMPDVDIFERGLSGRATTNPFEFYKQNMSPEVNGRMDNAYSEFIHSNLYIDDTPAITIQHIQKESRLLRKKHGDVGLICVDYLTLMESGKAERNDLAYGAITKALKNLAKELNCIVLMLTQLNRGLESRQDKKPVPSDSRDTGQIEQDVDLWIGLYKDSVYNDEHNSGLTEVLVRLNRHGGTGSGFVEMREGYHVPISLEDGAREMQQWQSSKLKEEDKKKFKR